MCGGCAGYRARLLILRPSVSVLQFSFEYFCYSFARRCCFVTGARLMAQPEDGNIRLGGILSQI